MSYFLQPYTGSKMFKLDLSNYVTKFDLKNVTDVDTWKIAKKFNLAKLKSDVDKLDIDDITNCSCWFN